MHGWSRTGPAWQNGMMSLRARPLPLFLLAALAVGDASAASPSDGKRLVSLGVTRAGEVPETIHQTVADTFTAQLSLAARERGFEEVPLSRVSGLEERAARCRDRRCRLDVVGRVKATHSIRAHLERDGRGYRLTLFLEDGASGAFLGGKRMSGELPILVGDLREKVDELLEEASPKRAVAMSKLAKTARGYLEKGRRDDALRTLERAIDISPFHPEGATLQLERLDLLAKGDDEDAAFRALLEVVDTYGPRSIWTLSGIGDSGAREALHQSLRQRLAAVATSNQREAQRLDDKAKKDDDARLARARRMERAEQAYEVYLLEFPDAPDAPELTLYLAELEYARGAYDEAATHYGAVLAAPQAQREHRQQAASAAVYAREKVLDDATAKGEVSQLDLAAPLAPLEGASGLATVERDFVVAVDALVGAFPDAEDADAFAYRAAQMCVFRGELDEGKRRLDDVAKRWPRSQAGKLARRALAAWP